MADAAVQVVAYLGDATGNHTYSGLDASYIARVSVGLDGGFGAFRMKDPMIIGDTTSNDDLGGLDASYVARKSVGLPQDEIPDLPGILPPILPGGVDPLVTVGSAASGRIGAAVTLPVTIDDATGTQSVDNLKIEYDTTLLDVSDFDVALGSVLASGSFLPTVNVDDTSGTRLSGISSIIAKEQAGHSRPADSKSSTRFL